MIHSKKTVHASHPSTHAPKASSAEAPSASVEAAATPPASLSFADRVTRAVAAIQEAQTLLNLDGMMPSATAVKHSVKFKKGGEPVVQALASLSSTYGVEVPSRPTADMTASLELATQLEPARAAIGLLSSVVDGAYSASRSSSWTTATSLYSMLKKGGQREPKLAAAIAPLQEYFAYRHPLVAEQHPKRSPTAKVEKAQAAAQKKIAKLQAQLAKLQAAVPPATEPTTPTPTTAPAPVPAAGPTNGAPH
jgi:hypothetical protein